MRWGARALGSGRELRPPELGHRVFIGKKYKKSLKTRKIHKIYEIQSKNHHQTEKNNDFKCKTQKIHRIFTVISKKKLNFSKNFPVFNFSIPKNLYTHASSKISGKDKKYTECRQKTRSAAGFRADPRGNPVLDVNYSASHSKKKRFEISERKSVKLVIRRHGEQGVQAGIWKKIIILPSPAMGLATKTDMTNI